MWFTKFSCFDGKLAKDANLRKPKGATDHFGFCFSLFLFRFLLFSLVLHFIFIFSPFDVIFDYLVFGSVSIFKVSIILKNKNPNQEMKNKNQKIEKTKNRRGRPSCFAVGSIWRMELLNRRRPGL